MNVGQNLPLMILKFVILLLIILRNVQNDEWSESEILDLINANEDVVPESSIFDSYYNMTDLEYYPDVCKDYANEDCAVDWLAKINEISINNKNRFGNIYFKYSTDINEENLQLKKKFQAAATKISLQFKLKVNKFQWKSFPSPEIRRKFWKLTSSIRSENETISKEINKIDNEISGIYNHGTPCFKTCLQQGETGIVDLFKNERDYDILAGYWKSWRDVTGKKMRQLYIDRMNLENIGARENNHADVFSFILFKDFEEKDFDKTAMKLYEIILPFYKELHAYVRYCLAKHYPGRFDDKGPIPAHLFGNVWAQQWMNIFPIIKDCIGDKDTNNFQQEANENLKRYSIKKMFQISEDFYESIGMYKMTDQFWERSILENPPGKLVNCHGSAHDLANGVDFRIKMCTEKNINDLTTIHHEMGHIQYYMAYKHLPTVLRGSANSGFHEAIGDTIALAVKTPDHLKKIGLISEVPKSEEFDINYLMATALEKVAFLPFAIMMDSYVWSLYNGSVPVSELNRHWWNLRYRFQGLNAPVSRSEKDFDAGAKYHIAFGVPYIRYFVSFLIQFQFYESMCEMSGAEGPLHRCDFYQSKEAGSKLLAMLKQGQSRPWRETIGILTGSDEINPDSFLKFFDPLHKWLKKENKRLKNHIGW